MYTAEEQLQHRMKWAEVLRSGEYKQGRSYLARDGKFCCLGVACELYQKEVGDLVVEVESFSTTRYDNSVHVLPRKVQDWLGITENGELKKGEYVAHLNDHGWTFEQIAELIETDKLKT